MDTRMGTVTRRAVSKVAAGKGCVYDYPSPGAAVRYVNKRDGCTMVLFSKPKRKFWLDWLR
jgi:hypothetical protein